MWGRRAKVAADQVREDKKAIIGVMIEVANSLSHYVKNGRDRRLPTVDSEEERKRLEKVKAAFDLKIQHFFFPLLLFMFMLLVVAVAAVAIVACCLLFLLLFLFS